MMRTLTLVFHPCEPGHQLGPRHGSPLLHHCWFHRITHWPKSPRFQIFWDNCPPLLGILALTWLEILVKQVTRRLRVDRVHRSMLDVRRWVTDPGCSAVSCWTFLMIKLRVIYLCSNGYIYNNREHINCSIHFQVGCTINCNQTN